MVQTNVPLKKLTMAQRKWKGKITKELRNGYGSVIKKGEEVICWKRQKLEENIIDDRLIFKGNYEYHYNTKTAFVRTTEFLIENQFGCEIIKNQKNQKL